MRNNHVFSVLPIADTAVLAKDKNLADLAVGQLGIFNADTNTSIDATQVATVSRFYLAVAVDYDGDGTVDDYLKSAGDHIAKTKVIAWEGSCGVTRQEKIVKVTGFKNGCCTNDYGIKVHLYNTRIGTNFGFNDLVKTYITKTDCCGDCCDGCTEAPCYTLLDQLRDDINADPDALVTATLHDPSNDALIDDLAVWVAANPDVCPDLHLTGSFEAQTSYCQINEDYIEPNGLNFSVSTIGWTCPLTTSTFQELIFEETSGYDAAFDEYTAGGWNGRPGPYRQYESGPIFGPSPVSNLIDKTKNYNTFHLTYDDVHASGFQTFTDTLNTTILAECGGDVSFAAVVDALAAASGMPAVANDVASCCGD